MANGLGTNSGFWLGLLGFEPKILERIAVRSMPLV